jgi:hypothetical protein
MILSVATMLDVMSILRYVSLSYVMYDQKKPTFHVCAPSALDSRHQAPSLRISGIAKRKCKKKRNIIFNENFKTMILNAVS